MQDKEDDMRVGVKSMALRFGDSTKVWISGFGAACISSLALSGHNANLGMLVLFLSLPAHICASLLLLALHIYTSLPSISLIVMVGTEWPYYVFLVAGSTQLAWQILTVDLSSRADCNRKWVPQCLFSVV